MTGQHCPVWLGDLKQEMKLSYHNDDKMQQEPMDYPGQSTEWIFVRTSSTHSTKSEQVALPRRSESENHNLLHIFDATEAFTRLP